MENGLATEVIVFSAESSIGTSRTGFVVEPRFVIEDSLWTENRRSWFQQRPALLHEAFVFDSRIIPLFIAGVHRNQ